MYRAQNELVTDTHTCAGHAAFPISKLSAMIGLALDAADNGDDICGASGRVLRSGRGTG